MQGGRVVASFQIRYALSEPNLRHFCGIDLRCLGGSVAAFYKHNVPINKTICRVEAFAFAGNYWLRWSIMLTRRPGDRTPFFMLAPLKLKAEACANAPAFDITHIDPGRKHAIPGNACFDPTPSATTATIYPIEE